MTEHRWSSRQRAALVMYAPWIGLAWGALLGLAAGALLPWALAQTVGAVVGAVVGWRVGRQINGSRQTSASPGPGDGAQPR